MSLRLPSRSRSRSTFRQPTRELSGNRLTKSHPSTRGTTPSPRLSCRPSKLDVYLSKSSRRGSSNNLESEPEHVPTGLHAREIKRWDGIQRMTARWDSLRKDSELWLHNGDCVIHLYEKGSSRRGASLRVSLADIESSSCQLLLNEHQLELLDPNHSPVAEPDRASRFSSYIDDVFPQYELFIAAPSHLSREEAFQYHITTRNFFAWMYNRPLVGDRLGQAMIRLQQRMDRYRPDKKDNQDTVQIYLEDQGYLDFRHCPDHALALLQYAEHYQLRELWTDAFVHCSGMNDELDASCECENVSRASQALIVRAHIEMDIRLERAGKSLEDFLENDIPGPDLDLGKQAQTQLDKFRSFLQGYYVQRYGYWPPAVNRSSSDALPKPVYQSMYFDLRNLYEYLADKCSDEALQKQFTETGVKVIENIKEFDMKNRFTSLPYTHPLLPELPEALRHRKSAWNIFSYGAGKKERRLGAFAALKTATNHDDHRVMSSNIVREYLRFERDGTMIEDPNVSCSDARKVRWILVYAMLQVLISISRIPDEVRDIEGVTYPLCCQTAGTPPWSASKPEAASRKQSLQQTSLVSMPDSFTDLKPTPLRVPQTTSSPPQQIAVPADSPIKAPTPIRSRSIELLHNTSTPSPSSPSQSDARPRPLSISAPILPPIHYHPLDPTLPSSTEYDPSTPSSSEMGGSAGWSSSPSEDGMDHHSIGAESNYGDDEDEGVIKGPQSVLKVPRISPKPLRKVPCGESLAKANPEVEQFLRG